MKSIRFGWPEEALYWLRVMERGKAGSSSLRKRVFRSAGEDCVDIEAQETAEALLTRMADPEALGWATYLVALGTKWYESPLGREYVRTRIKGRVAGKQMVDKGIDTATALRRYRRALAARNAPAAFEAFYAGRSLKADAGPFYAATIEAGNSADGSVARLATLLERHGKWLEELQDRHYIRQMIWAVTAGPFPLVNRQPVRVEYERLSEMVAKRLRREVEPIPSWAKDGVHAPGNDPRFAGDDEGCLNMAAMAERDGGRLDPSQPGVSRQVGQRVRRRGVAKPINKPQTLKAPSAKKIEAAIALFTKKLAAKEALAKAGKTVAPYTGKPIAKRIEGFRRKLTALMAQAKTTKGS
jgi:hypothetical protein